VERTAGKFATANSSFGGRVLVLATPLTLQEQKFRDLVSRVDNEKVVDFLALPELVDLAERFVFNEATMLPLLIKKFSEIDTATYGTIVLGCTHFPFFKNTIAKLFPPLINIIDGNEGTVRHLKNVLQSKNLLTQQKKNSEAIYYDSGKKANAKRFEKYLAILK
jgi:glutamate racemase